MSQFFVILHVVPPSPPNLVPLEFETKIDPKVIQKSGPKFDHRATKTHFYVFYADLWVLRRSKCIDSAVLGTVVDTQ